MRRRLAATLFVLAGLLGAAVLLVLGQPGAELYAGFSLLVVVAGGLIYAGGHWLTAAGFGLVAVAALVLGGVLLAVQGSVDLLVVMLIVLAVVAGGRGYQYLRAARAGWEPVR